jgi:RNA polymerase sigma factor (sigma-70 family)
MLSPESLRDLYRSHAIELLQVARRRVGGQEAEDVVQDAYLHLLQRSRAESIDNPRAYLFRITANAAIDQLRRSKVRISHQSSEHIDPVDLGDARAYGAERLCAWRLRAAIAEMPAVHREVFLLNRFEGLTAAEIASRLHLSVRTIDRYLSKALAFLKDNLGED